MIKYRILLSEMGKDESYGKLTFVIQVHVYPSTAYALTNWSVNSVFLT